MKKKTIFVRFTMLLTLFLVTFAASCPPAPIRRLNFFPRIAPRAVSQPPQDQLMVWLTGGQSSFEFDPSGRVLNWHDSRGGTASAVEEFKGQSISTTITTPDGTSRTVMALRCGPSRCAYSVAPGPGARPSLDGTPYTVLAVVRRSSARGDNYFVMTRGRGCDGNLGGINCERNTALHVGWSGERTIRLGQYGDVGRQDVIFEPAPAFAGSASPISLFVAVSATGEGKTIALLEPTINDGNTVLDTTPLANTGTLFVGGTPFRLGRAMPDWHFEGDIFEVLIYTKLLTPSELSDAQDYLRSRYGPR